MRPRLLPGEYVYRDEVFPVSIIGIAINLAGSFLIQQIKEYVNNPTVALLFQDTTGTAFVALALGPWWGAAAGVISSTFNTFMAEKFEDAFAYALVNAGLGLAWGYAGRAVSADAVLIAPKNSGLGRRAPFATLALLLAGIVTTTILAGLIKIALLEKAGGQFGQGDVKPLYDAIEEHLRRIGTAGDARILALALLDLYGSAIDKSVSLLLALGLVQAIGLVPAVHTKADRTFPAPLGQRLKVGADSIICFAIIYAAYLLACKWILRDVHFPGSPPGSRIDNFAKPAAVLLFLPFIVACVAFVFGTLKSGRGPDARIEASRLNRSNVYDRIRKPKSWARSYIEKSEFLSQLQKKSVYGVITSLFAWPAKDKLDKLPIHLPISWSWITFFAMVAVSSVFFVDRRETLSSLRKTLDWRDDLKKRLAWISTEA
jgi:hypothetical protein